MAQQNGITQKVGLALLGIGTAAGVHSALSPSLFTLASFAGKPVEKRFAREGLFIGLGVGAIVTTGMQIAFKDWTSTVATGLGFLIFAGLGFWRLATNNVEESTMAQKREEQLKVGLVVQRHRTPIILRY
jgi:hypothetical protein